MHPCLYRRGGHMLSPRGLPLAPQEDSHFLDCHSLFHYGVLHSREIELGIGTFLSSFTGTPDRASALSRTRELRLQCPPTQPVCGLSLQTIACFLAVFTSFHQLERDMTSRGPRFFLAYGRITPVPTCVSTIAVFSVCLCLFLSYKRPV